MTLTCHFPVFRTMHEAKEKSIISPFFEAAMHFKIGVYQQSIKRNISAF